MRKNDVAPPGVWNSAIERRRGRRFQLQLSCRLKALDGNIEWRGRTSDISLSGVLLLVADVSDPGKLPRVGEAVRVLIDLPHSANIAPRCMECLGMAVWMTPDDDGGFLFAVEFRRVRVCDRKGKTFKPGGSLITSVLVRGSGR